MFGALLNVEQRSVLSHILNFIALINDGIEKKNMAIIRKYQVDCPICR